MTAAGALLRFQLRSGARVGLRQLVPWVALAVVALGSQEDPGRAIATLGSRLAGPHAVLSMWLVPGASCLAIAWWAMPKIALSDRRWLGHLPASRRARRFARIGAVLAVQSPLVAAASGLVLAEAAASGPRALRWLPAPLVLAGLSALVAELGRSSRRSPHAVASRLRLPFDLLVFWRAVGPRLADAFLVAGLPIAATFLFLRNNALPTHLARLGLTLGTGIAASSILAILAVALHARRPPWSWARSLPVGSRRRVRTDALVLGAHAAPACVVAAVVDPIAGCVLIGALPLLALRASALIRGSVERRGTGARIVAEGAAASGLLALLPWLALAALVLVPTTLNRAAVRDRALRVP